MRVGWALIAALAGSTWLVAACAGDGGAEPSSSPSPFAASPSLSESGEEASSLSVDDPRPASFVPVDPGMLGMHVAGAQEGDWPSDRVPVESFRLWDTGTSWLQIEANRGRYDWRLLDRALETSSLAGVDDVLIVNAHG